MFFFSTSFFLPLSIIPQMRYTHLSVPDAIRCYNWECLLNNTFKTLTSLFTITTSTPLASAVPSYFRSTGLHFSLIFLMLSPSPCGTC